MLCIDCIQCVDMVRACVGCSWWWETRVVSRWKIEWKAGLSWTEAVLCSTTRNNRYSITRYELPSYYSPRVLVFFDLLADFIRISISVFNVSLLLVRNKIHLHCTVYFIKGW